MARHKRFSNFEGQITEDMLTEYADRTPTSDFRIYP